MTSALIAGALVIGLSSCAHYQLGSQGKLSFHTLYIEPVANDTQLPQATAVISTQVRDAFLHDSRVSLVSSPEEADATLKITLVHYLRGVATVRPGDTGLARKFDLTLDAVCTLRENQSGKLLFEKRPVTAVRQIFTTPTPQAFDARGEVVPSNQLQAEYQTLPLLASSLADRISHTVLDVW